MKISMRFMFPDMKDGIDAEADYEADTLTLGNEGEVPQVFNLGHINHCLVRPYRIHEPDGGWKKDFTNDEKAKLRPIAETLAMLDGNAFFGVEIDGRPEWYEGYLPEAHALYERNGGDGGWAGQASFAKKQNGK